MARHYQYSFQFESFLFLNFQAIIKVYCEWVQEAGRTNAIVTESKLIFAKLFEKYNRLAFSVNDCDLLFWLAHNGVS